MQAKEKAHLPLEAGWGSGRVGRKGLLRSLESSGEYKTCSFLSCLPFTWVCVLEEIETMVSCCAAFPW
jgi:hypothetical protein